MVKENTKSTTRLAKFGTSYREPKSNKMQKVHIYNRNGSKKIRRQIRVPKWQHELSSYDVAQNSKRVNRHVSISEDFTLRELNKKWKSVWHRWIVVDKQRYSEYLLYNCDDDLFDVYLTIKVPNGDKKYMPQDDWYGEVEPVCWGSDSGCIQNQRFYHVALAKQERHVRLGPEAKPDPGQSKRYRA